MIHLDLRTDLKKVRANINMAGMGECKYSSPCAIGAMIDDPAERQSLDAINLADVPNVQSLLETGRISAPEDQHDDLAELQAWFDAAAPDFEEVLTELEAKYADA